MQFVVPQFIEVESKVIGPISVRQFIILLFTGGIIFIWYSLFSTVVFVLLGLITLAIGLVFAFAKVNSQPFHNFALSLIQTLRRPRLSLWQREVHRQVVVKVAKKDQADLQAKRAMVTKPEVSPEHIAELSLIVDTSGQYASADLERLRQEQANQPTSKPPTQTPQ